MLSSGLMLPTFMTTHFFQFRFADTEQYWHLPVCHSAFGAMLWEQQSGIPFFSLVPSVFYPFMVPVLGLLLYVAIETVMCGSISSSLQRVTPG